MAEQTLRLFVSSPSDVAEERRRVELVAARLNAEFEKRISIKVIRWETEYYSAHETFQPQIPEAAECDVVVAIFRARLGTELPPNFPKLSDGRPYPSGTAYEILSAIAARRAGKGLPDVYVFRYPQPPSVRLDDPEEALVRAQWDRLKEFFETWFKTSSGQFVAAFQTFTSTDEFAEKLEDCLRRWLARRGFASQGPLWDRQIDGNPFPGLSAFDAARQRVYFGRELAASHALARLREAGARGTPFLLVIGGSGTGKSSFLRAGLMPRLMRPGTIPEIDLWRPAFAVASAEPISSLVEALFTPQALGDELRAGDFRTRQALEALFAGNPETAMAPVRAALERAAQKRAAEAQFESVRPVRLLLALDQLERLFLEADRTRAQAFAGIVASLVRHRLAYVTAALRSDTYPQFQLVDEFRNLRTEGATFDLVAPTPGELEEIITQPVEACRPPLAFELRNGCSLAAVLVADAKGGDALPLLQMTLARLFDAEASRGDGLLRFDDYPGISAAVAKAADEALATVSEEARLQVPHLVTALVRDVTVDVATGATLPIVAPLDRAQFEHGQKARTALIDAFISSRLLTLEGDGDAVRVRPVHEALFRTWPQAVAIIGENASLIRVRRALEPIVREWSSAAGASKARHLELSPALLDAAQQLRDRFGDDLPAPLREFIAQCLAVDAARRSHERRRQRNVLMATVAALIIVACLGLSAWWQRNAAEQNYSTALDLAAALVQKIESNSAEGVSESAAKELLAIAQQTFAQLPQRNTPEVAEARIKLLLVFSEVQTADLPQALSFARQAEALAVALAAINPGNIELQREMLDAFDRLGDVLRAQGDLVQASQEYKSELAPLLRLASSPAGADLKPRVWGLREKIGDTLRMQGDLVQALTNYQSALSGLAPGNLRDLALSHDKVAQIMWLQGNRVQSLAELNAALTMWEGLASEQPGNIYWQVMRVVERSKIASATAAGQGAQPALLPDFILPASSERRLGEQDIAGLGREQLRLARNEIFARHGRYFKEPVLGGYFSQFLWYRPYTWLTDLTADETANVNFLLSAEQQAKPSANFP